MILSTQILDEAFIPKYDLTALFFIVAGCVTVVLNANFEQTEYTVQEVKELLKAPRTIIFVVVCVLCILLSICLLSTVLRALRRFEIDVEAY